jgi:hypothetical protein
LLDLSNNFISSLAGISRFYKLETLIFRNNTISAVKDDFRDMPFLKEVDLSFNEHLKSVGDFAFFSLPSLEYISFADCRELEWFGHRSVYDSYSLNEIDFSFTKIKALSQHVTTYCPSLRSILLDGVDLVCSCLNTWMFETKVVQMPEDNYCDYGEMKKTKICAPILISHDEISVDQGQELFIRCLALGEPSVTVRLFDQDDNVVGYRKGKHLSTCCLSSNYNLISRKKRRAAD